MILNVRHAIQLLFGFGERGIVWGLVKCFICREDVGQMTWLFEFYIRMVFTFEVFQPMSPTYYNINNPNTPQSHLQLGPHPACIFLKSLMRFSVNMSAIIALKQNLDSSHHRTVFHYSTVYFLRLRPLNAGNCMTRISGVMFSLKWVVKDHNWLFVAIPAWKQIDFHLRDWRFYDGPCLSTHSVRIYSSYLHFGNSAFQALWKGL